MSGSRSVDVRPNASRMAATKTGGTPPLAAIAKIDRASAAPDGPTHGTSISSARLRTEASSNGLDARLCAWSNTSDESHLKIASVRLLGPRDVIALSRISYRPSFREMIVVIVVC